MKVFKEKIACKKIAFGIIVVVLGLFNLIVMTNKVNAASQTYSIIYNANGGTGAPMTQTKMKDKTIVLSSKMPQRTGHKFLGWATTGTSKTVKYKPGSKYSGNSSLRLYAVWEANTYKVSYNANGGSGAPVSQTKTYGKDLKITTITPKRTGYTFQGWAKSKSITTPQYKGGSVFKENKDTILYAVWKIKTYTIKYDANKGVNAPDTQTKKYGQTITLSKKIPKRENYTFIGWSKNPSSQLPDYKAGDRYSANASTVLYAYWMQDTFKITYHANGGSGGISSQTKKRKEDLKLSKNIPKRSGYTFLGWGLSANATTISYYPGDMYKLNSEKDLYAIWGKTMRNSFKTKHLVVSAAPNGGIIDANLVYEEDYKKSGKKISFYNHRTYFTLNGELLNDKDEATIYPPKIITHKNEETGKEKKFIVKAREDVLERADYSFAYVNREKVTYDVSDIITGSCGYMIVFGITPQRGRVEISLSGDEGAKKVKSTKSVQVQKKDYYQSLGAVVNDSLKETNLKGRRQENLNLKKNKRVIASYDNEIIYDTDVKALIEEKRLSDIVTEEAIKDIIYKEVVRRELDKEVALNGCEKSIQDAESYISKIRSELPQIDNYNEYLLFIDGTGMSEDAYWESQEEPYRKSLGRSEYLEKLYMEYLDGKTLSISNRYLELDEMIRKKNPANKQEFIKSLRELIAEMRVVNIEQKVIELYL